MADDATVTGDDQSEQTGEGQQAQVQTIEYMGRQLTPEQLKEELDNTNAYVTKLQQQQAQQQTQPPKDKEEDDTQVDESSVTPEQRKLIQRLAGADELKAEIAALKKERENEQQQAQQQELESQFKAISQNDEYKEAGVPLPVSIAEKQALIEYMNETRIFNPEVAFRHKHSSRLEQAKETQTAKSDKSDTEQVTKQNAYREALSKAKNLEEIAQVEAQFKGDPTSNAFGNG